MTLLTNDDVAKRELCAGELDAVSAGRIVITHGPNPPMGGSHGCHGGHHSPPPRFYPGGSPNSPGLHPIYY